MPTVNTVNGPVDTRDLGFTLMHEHIIVMSPGVKENFPVFDRKAEVAAAAQKLKDVASRGVKTLVDLTVADWRDIPFVKDVVKASGNAVNVIVATGIYWEVPHYFSAQSGRSIDFIADLFTRDIQEGIMDTGVKAGIVKCATDEPGVTPDVERILRASAKAHRKTGVPISTHTHAKSEVGLKQQDVFESEGVDLSRVVIGHSGDTEDTAYLKKICDRGSFIGMDRFGIDIFLPTANRVATIARMCEMGYAGQMVLSHDAACHFGWADKTLIGTVVPNWHFNHIPDDVLPALKAAGVTDEQITAMTVDNPRKVFERQGAY
ncbi:MAG TPA: phosphotriesterase-related protein [Dehalococcoidia bacterium]|jgi:phosphotriesterase-related protein|nr:phosphotriesterase-related protein [Dehalococcoidia bacterium]